MYSTFCTYINVKLYTENFARRFTVTTMEGSYDAVNVSANFFSFT